jgi:hypothetical protein
MIQYLTRLTPNYNKWEKPSGSDGKCGLEINSPYEGINGFGWEEWLLYDFHNPDNQLDGYCYGFIQAFHKMNKAQERLDRLYLYTRACNVLSKADFYVGYIDFIEILKHPFTQKNLLDKKEKFCKKAEQDLININISGYKKDLLEMCSEDTLFNVRFKSEHVYIKDFDFKDRPINLQRGQSRFKLYDLDTHSNILSEINKYE